MTRSIFLKSESYADVQTALAKADTEEERHHLISERLKKNGWDKEKELNFRRHCEVIGFTLAFRRAKENPLDKDNQGRASARFLSDAIKNGFRQDRLTGEVE